jgi:hypothetical protein
VITVNYIADGLSRVVHVIRAECESDFDCGLRDVCRDYKCVNPCIGNCGENALCNVVNRIATCSCPEGNEYSNGTMQARASSATYIYCLLYI